MERQYLQEGWFGPYVHAENETETVSSKGDPAADRMAVNEEVVEHNLGKKSWGTRRSTGIHDEHAYIQGQLYRGPDGGMRTGQGTIELCTRGAGQEACEQRMLIREDAIVCNVPIQAPNLAGSALRESNELRAPGGVFWLVIQGSDGNIVAYANQIPYDYSTGKPYWSSGPYQPQS